MLNPITPVRHPDTSAAAPTTDVSEAVVTEASLTEVTAEPSEVSVSPTASALSEASAALSPAAETEPVIAALPAPGDEILTEELTPLRSRYPRMDVAALLHTEAFRSFGESVGWDTRELTARLPELIEASRTLTAAVEPPVSRATFSAASHHRPLLTPAQARELAAWNRDYPAYRMSELEYFNALGK